MPGWSVTGVPDAIYNETGTYRPLFFLHACGGLYHFLRLSAPATASAAAVSADASSAEDAEAWNSSDDCTAGATFALQGVDLVAYFSLAEGDEPVIGSAEHASIYGAFEFKFSSARNKALFEVWYIGLANRFELYNQWHHGRPVLFGVCSYFSVRRVS